MFILVFVHRTPVATLFTPTQSILIKYIKISISAGRFMFFLFCFLKKKKHNTETVIAEKSIKCLLALVATHGYI